MDIIELKFKDDTIYKSHPNTNCKECELSMADCGSDDWCTCNRAWKKVEQTYCIWTNHTHAFSTSCGYNVPNNPQGAYCYKCGKLIKIRGAE